MVWEREQVPQNLNFYNRKGSRTMWYVRNTAEMVSEEPHQEAAKVGERQKIE